jgi:hypothetical protein
MDLMERSVFCQLQFNDVIDLSIRRASFLKWPYRLQACVLLNLLLMRNVVVICWCGISRFITGV